MEMDDGFTRQYRTKLDVMYKVAAKWRMTSTQLRAFKSWLATDVKFGADPFSMPMDLGDGDPVAYVVRIVGGTLSMVRLDTEIWEVSAGLDSGDTVVAVPDDTYVPLPPLPPVSEDGWILDGGMWQDVNFWYDAEVWQD
jgi:hypothetical protein